MTQHNELPHGWHLAGSRPAHYRSSLSDAAVGESPTLCLSARESPAPPEGFGTVMQTFRADAYRGQRLRFSARVRSDGVTDWAGLWMRVDGPERGQSLAFDNMQERPIRGTGPREEYEVVLDVPAEATRIAFGILLNGPGAVWLSEARVEVVGSDVSVTGQRPRVTDLPEHPVNLELIPAAIG
jgi:hypothetical protein